MTRMTGLLSGLLMIGVAAIAVSAQPTGPSVHVLESRYEFPMSVEGQTITHDFVLRNRGTEDLIIHSVRPG